MEKETACKNGREMQAETGNSPRKALTEMLAGDTATEMKSASNELNSELDVEGGKNLWTG